MSSSKIDLHECWKYVMEKTRGAGEGIEPLTRPDGVIVGIPVEMLHEVIGEYLATVAPDLNEEEFDNTLDGLHYDLSVQYGVESVYAPIRVMLNAEDVREAIEYLEAGKTDKVARFLQRGLDTLTE